MKLLVHAFRGYTCRACGYVTTNQDAFRKCPVCGIKWGLTQRQPALTDPQVLQITALPECAPDGPQRCRRATPWKQQLVPKARSPRQCELYYDI